jgi:hypothetical protein
MITKLYEQRLKKDLSRLAILSLITVVIWIIIAVYRALNKSQITPDVKKQILPLTTSIDLDTMELIKNRVIVTEANWANLNLVENQPILESPTTLEEGSVASSSAVTQTDQQQEATDSGSVEL